MDATKFEAQLRTEGYTEIETKTIEARPANGEHGHHFAVRGLVLDGAFIVHMDGHPTTYRPGDIFAVAQAHPHCEETGPDGARVLFGRKY